MLPRGTPFDHPKSFLRDVPRFFAMPREVPKRFRVGFPAVPAQLRAKIESLALVSIVESRVERESGIKVIFMGPTENPAFGRGQSAVV